MYYNTQSIPDKILNYIYFNNHCELVELENNTLREEDVKLEDILAAIGKLEKENLLTRKGEIFELTPEGKIAVENFNSYEDYKSVKTSK
jgi:hypothetical protein